jgi:hypothetical protein
MQRQNHAGSNSKDLASTSKFYQSPKGAGKV